MIGAGLAGKCTATPGVLAQFEIEEMLKNGIKATHDSVTETYWFDSQVRISP